MSLWNVTPAFSTIMMTTVYDTSVIIAVTLITVVVGLPQNCLQYCKSSHNQTVVLPGCECPLYNTSNAVPTTLNTISTPIKDNEIYYEPVVPNFLQKTHFDDQTLSMLNFNINLYSKPSTLSATESNERLRRAEYEIEKESEPPLHIYLDLDLNTTGNNYSLQLENVKKMFMNFHAVEKNLSQCINLYIYIFSKSIDVSSKADSQKLTEIQNKCNQTASLIRESIYQIKQPLSQGFQDTYEEDAYEVSFSDDISHTLSSYMDTISTTDEYTRTHNTEANYEKSTETTKTNADIDTLNLPQNINKDYVTKYDIDKSVTEITYRPKITDEEIKIPRILTKELSNGSLFSTVDGYEDMTTSEFATTSVITTTAGKKQEIKISTSNPIPIDSNVDDKIFHTGLMELQGRLYFSFGSIQIPARFIQHTDGELNVAIDALSICNQMFEENSSNFMNLLCKSIKLHDLN